MKLGDIEHYDADHVRNHAPTWKKWLHRYFRVKVRGMEKIPDKPFLGVGNHSGGVMLPDTLCWLAAYHSEARDTPLHTLGHDAIFDRYPAFLRDWMARFGTIRADHEIALKALRSGHAVQVYPGGDLDACRPFSRRNQIIFGGHLGYIDLAQKADVPIIPVVCRGGHRSILILRSGARLARLLGVDRSLRLKALPVSLSLPWGLWVGPVPGYIPLPFSIEIDVLDPVDPHGDPMKVDKDIRKLMQKVLSGESS